ncbi:MAG: ATP-dependent nuclease subunit B-like protein [Solirubrobacterales bacterium]|nr:ATP-dependent nuclease subunit B-like protein [Solirubrobacterales bacterium]
MPLTLVTGPANAEKARVVLDALQAAAERDPMLVVPTRADALVYRRELAARGLVFGADVQTWSGLARAMARGAGVRGRPIGGLSRERVAALAVQRTSLQVLGASAQTPGFTGTLLALFDELGEQRITPQRWYAAMRAWSAVDEARTAYAEDLAALYGAYHRSLQTVARVDEPMHVVAVHDALRTDPSRWPGRPVFLYGFDDLEVLQVDAIETLARHCAADVMVSLPFEAGRAAFAGRAGTYQDLMALGAHEIVLDAGSEHYAPAARTVLHHLERSLLETDHERLASTEDAVLLLQGGGERAELELVAAHVARLIASGTPAAEIAIVLRRPESQAALIARVLAGYDIPFTLRRTLPLGHTALGRGLLAMARCALLDGSADDLLVWLRTPGLVRDTARVDKLEADVRRAGMTSARQARALWEEGPWKLHELDRLRDAQRRGPRTLCERLAADAMRLFTGPHRGHAAVLSAAQRHEARVAGQLRAALAELGALADADPQLVPEPAALLALLAALEVEADAGSADASDAAGAVTVADPLAVRARRVRALFVCGLQEGTFPAPGRPEAFLPDAERRAVNAAGGLRLALREDTLGAERYLFYAAVSRPTQLLALSWHDATDDGRPAVRSLLVDDVLDLFQLDAAARVQRRALGAAGFPQDDGLAPPAPTAHAAAMAIAERDGGTANGRGEGIDVLRDPVVLQALADRTTWSASALETWVACPVRWFVERLLSPEVLLPDPEPMVRGELAHKVLEAALGALRDDDDAARGPLRPEHLPRARALAIAALREHADAHRISPDPHRLAAALHRLQADILRYLEYAAHAGSAYAPSAFELRFGGRGDELPAVALTDELSLQGRVDRVDLSADGTRAIVYDYKGATATARAKWEADGRLQLPLYLLALPQLLGAQVDGGLYQPLSGEDPRPRGLLRADADPDLDCVKADRADDDAEFDAALATARETALQAIGELRAGRLQARPATCGWRDGGCSYPSICRCES